jgi:hypothetical protein
LVKFSTKHDQQLPSEPFFQNLHRDHLNHPLTVNKPTYDDVLVHTHNTISINSNFP